MVYGSVCSGIEAATVAWHPLGWRATWFAEIENFPSAVLAYHYPNVPNMGDFTTISGKHVTPIDVLVGGTPCQSFSIAGKQAGMDDARGKLAIRFCHLAADLRVKWVVWENVPRVLSINGGKDFGAIIGALQFFGYGIAWRVLDAQYFGVPQRRRRVFIVGYLGDWRRAAAVLFEPGCLRGNSAASRKTKQETAGTVTSGAHRRRGAGIEPEVLTVSHTLRADGHDASEDGTGRGTPLIVTNGEGTKGLPSLSASGVGKQCNSHGPLLVIQERAVSDGSSSGPAWSGISDLGVAYTLEARRTPQAVGVGQAVRRLTPRECERLQGFPDDYTLIPYRGKPREKCADGPRYKVIGNSMAVPVMNWIGRRIQMVEEIG